MDSLKIWEHKDCGNADTSCITLLPGRAFYPVAMMAKEALMGASVAGAAYTATLAHAIGQ